MTITPGILSYSSCYSLQVGEPMDTPLCLTATVLGIK